MNSLVRQASKDVQESVERLKRTLAKQGKTLDDWLEEERIRTEKIRKRVAEKAAKEAAESAKKGI